MTLHATKSDAFNISIQMLPRMFCVSWVMNDRVRNDDTL